MFSSVTEIEIVLPGLGLFCRLQYSDILTRGHQNDSHALVIPTSGAFRRNSPCGQTDATRNKFFGSIRSFIDNHAADTFVEARIGHKPLLLNVVHVPIEIVLR